MWNQGVITRRHGLLMYELRDRDTTASTREAEEGSGGQVVVRRHVDQLRKRPEQELATECSGQVDQTRAARARSAPPRSSTTDLVLRAVLTKTRAVLTKTRAVLTKTRAMKCTPIGVQICELQDFDDFDENHYATRISTV